MHLLAVAATLGAVALGVRAQSPAWGQCGGQGWSGPTTCVSGYTCTYSNPFYSQCLPGSGPPPTTTPPGGTQPPPTTTTSTGPAPTGSQIRTVQDPVFHFYLQDNMGVPQLGPEASSGRFTVNGTISLNGSNGSRAYLNVNNSATTSYKPLTLGSTATTTNWGLEGDTIIITNPRQLNFLACSTSSSSFYDVFLQNGNESPAGRSCTMVTMHLPCLC